MSSNNFKYRILSLVILFSSLVTLAGCNSEKFLLRFQERCPVSPINVTVSISQWSDIVSKLGGNCTKVTTILNGSKIDPHEFEPTPADAAKFYNAQLIVINGAHYDEWANRLAKTMAPSAVTLKIVSLNEEFSVNPHVWYSPAVINETADRVTKVLSQLSPKIYNYFIQRQIEFKYLMMPYQQLIISLKTKISGKRYAATENIFDNMASAIGLVNKTPLKYRSTSLNDSNCSPADLESFLHLLMDKSIDVLIYNTQTEGSLPKQIRTTAKNFGIPVVDITETLPSDESSFTNWQVNQLAALAKALKV